MQQANESRTFQRPAEQSIFQSGVYASGGESQGSFTLQYPPGPLPSQSTTHTEESSSLPSESNATSTSPGRSRKRKASPVSIAKSNATTTASSQQQQTSPPYVFQGTSDDNNPRAKDGATTTASLSTSNAPTMTNYNHDSSTPTKKSNGIMEASIEGEEDENAPGHLSGPPRPVNPSKRAEQNRKAQRAFRERRDAHVKELEERSLQLTQVQNQYADLSRRYEETRHMVEGLQQENQQLSAALLRATTGGLGISTMVDPHNNVPHESTNNFFPAYSDRGPEAAPSSSNITTAPPSVPPIPPPPPTSSKLTSTAPDDETVAAREDPSNSPDESSATNHKKAKH